MLTSIFKFNNGICANDTIIEFNCYKLARDFDIKEATITMILAQLDIYGE